MIPRVPHGLRTRRRPPAMVAACAVLPALIGCARPGTAEPDPAARPLVAVSIAPLAYLVEQLAGDDVEIAVMLPPGANPHAFDPGLAHAQALARARLRLRVGHPHLPFERALFERLAVAGAQAVEVRCVDDGQGAHEDPHVWVAPASMRACADRLLPALLALLPAQGPRLRERHAALLRDLDALDAELRAALMPLPRRRFYVYHPAWGHLARAYGLTEVAIEHDGKEPDPHQLSVIVEQARRDGARTLFVQPQFPRGSVQLVAEALGAQVQVLDPMARDWADNLRRVQAALHKELQP